MIRTRQERFRLGALFVLIVLFFGLAIARLAQLQIGSGDRYREIVQKQSSGQVTIPAERGLLYDRNGRVIAKNVLRSSLYAYPNDVSEVKIAGSYLDNLYHLKKGTAEQRFKLKPKKFRWVERHIDDQMADKIAAESPAGLFLRDDFYREYPFGQVGKQVIGFTDIDNNGQSGFELMYDSMLSGTMGIADVSRDGLRNTYKSKEQPLVKPQTGKSIVLTIDFRLQEIVEEELRKGVEKHHAKWGLAVFQDARSGDILAMAHYDPNEENPDKPAKLRAISDQFEPGSVFKAFTAAAVLDAGVVNFNELVYCENGKWKMGRRTLHDDKKHGLMTFREIIEVSSNIGTAKWALRVEGEDLFDTYKAFGFGKKLKCGLPGETAGALPKPHKWSDYNVAALAMGHSVAVNALQLANGFGCIANGGELVRPHLILGEVDDNGFVINKPPREVLAQSLKRSSVDTLQAILKGVVDTGTATQVRSDIIAIAGKTGTAEIPDLKNKRYFKNKFTATFGGFFPYPKPVVSGVVVFSEPEPNHYGGWTAGPVFKSIAERYVQINPDMFPTPERTLMAKADSASGLRSVPDLTGMTVAKALRILSQRGLRLRCTTEGGKIVWQYPPASREVIANDEVLVVATNSRNEPLMMADLVGLPARRAAAYLSHAGVKFSLQGNGLVRLQSLPPGEMLNSTMEIVLQCQAEPLTDEKEAKDEAG